MEFFISPLRRDGSAYLSTHSTQEKYDFFKKRTHFGLGKKRSNWKKEGRKNGTFFFLNVAEVFIYEKGRLCSIPSGRRKNECPNKDGRTHFCPYLL